MHGGFEFQRRSSLVVFDDFDALSFSDDHVVLEPGDFRFGVSDGVAGELCGLSLSHGEYLRLLAEEGERAVARGLHVGMKRYE